MRGSKNREAQLQRAPRRKLFGLQRRKTFLEWLAATGNCVFSSRQAGIAHQTVWKHRMNDPDFAAAFDRALDQGIARAKARQMEDRIKPGAITIDGDLDPEMIEPADPQIVLALVREHERARAGHRKMGRRPRVASNAEIEAALVKRLAAYSRRVRGVPAGAPAAVEDSGGGPLHRPPPSAPGGCPPRPGEEQGE